MPELGDRASAMMDHPVIARSAATRQSPSQWETGWRLLPGLRRGRNDRNNDTRRKTLHRRDRPGHHEHPLHRVRPHGRARSPARRWSTGRSIRSPAGSNTIRWRSGATPQTVIAEALRGADLTHRDLAAIGITNQRETTLLWDRATGAPVHNAMVWQDTRVDPLVAEYARDGGQDRFRAQTGLPLASYFVRAETALAARQRARCAPACGGRRPRVRHDR